MAFPFDSCGDSSDSWAVALEQLSQVLDTEAACGYVTLVNLARRRRAEQKNEEEREQEEEEGGTASPSAQNLGVRGGGGSLGIEEYSRLLSCCCPKIFMLSNVMKCFF